MTDQILESAMTGDQQFCFSYWLNTQLNCTDDNNPDTEHINCHSYEVEELKLFSNVKETIQISVIHINIHSIPAKFEKLLSLLSRLRDINIEIHFLLHCETFLTNNNASL